MSNNAPNFVHLRLHTEYSLIDGIVKIKPLIAETVAKGMPAVAVTDQMNLYALVKFYKAALASGIKPICGADLWLENDEASASPLPMLLLIQNKEGYRNLTELISQAYQINQHHEKAIIKKDWLKQKSAGLIAISGGKLSEIGCALLAGHQQQAESLVKEWQAIFPDRFYLELQRTGRENDEEYLHAAVALAEACCCPVVATNDVRFLHQEDFDAHEARVCIGEGRVLDDPRRPRRYSEQQYLRSPEEMVELFADIPEALANTVEIAKRCTIEVQLGKYFLPEYPVPEGKTMDQFFREFSHQGLEERLAITLDPATPDYENLHQQYIDRLNFELDIILQMGFPGYFLIVMDFIQWAKNNGVPVGPGRGSGAGSLVAYAQKITDLDPLEYDLLFERFLNPERVSMPDFDVDFCMDGRDRVIDYVAQNYGRDAVSQIITFGTMAAKAVVRDVARVQGKSYGLADKLSKMIPFEVGMTLSKAYEQEETIREFLASDEAAQEIWEMALKLEGTTRNVGKHAGGVVIAPTKLTDFAPLYCDEEGHGLVTQFDKDDVEQAGLVKFDFLGLRTLTIIDWALETINKRRAIKSEAPIDISQINLADELVFKLLQRAETTAVFQLESRGMKELIKRLLPSCFEDIIALVALFRPGPLQSGMVDDFINRKHGRATVEYPHPDLEPVLSNTYGVILYQEQVMQIAQVLANYTLGQADMLRRAMGKKKPEEMAKQREIFNKGASDNSIPAEQATYIFDLMEKFAGYGFNKSHSAAYALVSYQTAWLKAYFPAEFMAAVLSSDIHNTDKVVILIEECRSMKLNITPPNVNISEYKFTVSDQDDIVYGLGAIKGVGEGPIEAIVEARKEGGAFKDLFDFCKRIDGKKINKRVMEALVRSGALDRLGPAQYQKMAFLGKNRAVLFAAMEDALKAADQEAKSQDSGHGDLFGELMAETEQDCYEYYYNAYEWPDNQRLVGEKETLGLYLTGHPIDQYESEIKHIIRNRIVDLRPARESQYIAGLIVALRVMRNKRGQKMAFITLDDRTARIEVSVFSDQFEQYQQQLEKDALVIVEGEVSHDDYTNNLKVRAKSLANLTEARSKYARQLQLVIPEQTFKRDFVENLATLLAEYKGQLPVTIEYQKHDAKAKLILADQWRVAPTDELIQALKKQYGKNSVELQYR
ncbi:DNA polymerase III subunit alpha [Spartinivicinus poritis]|uniref:DNA polymerase III subunit alpha n=1 Tax=Spartinivicinus poritis TaxID=2994640 RepID=A0ABT5U1Z6_9GAMM|nr:DNA polymerase III subunit alpha [Spartinivicinus sp. A2-2]MDE1460384.1 DNA polymerase III subunit alpha [Spartinivicinus sp. A2-2]